MDSTGNIIVAGTTDSDQFPTTVGAFDRTLSGSYDIFVTKFDPTLSAILTSTLIGGDGTESVAEMGISPDGGVFLVGRTNSEDFPVTNGAFCTTQSGGDDGYFLELNPQGTKLNYSTLIGGSGDDYGKGFAFDSSGRPIIVGYTESTDFPLTSGCYNTSLSGSRDAFALKFETEFNSLVFSTLIGGDAKDAPIGVEILPDDSFIMAGTTDGGFPTTPGVYTSTFIDDGFFILRMESNGTDLIFSTMAPDGSGVDHFAAFTTDTQGNVYIVGASKSTDFPTTANALYRSLNSTRDSIVFVLSDGGKNLSYSTYINSNGQSYLYDVAINRNGTMLAVTGGVMGDALPVTPKAFDDTWRGKDENQADILLCVFDLSSMNINYATYIGGSEREGWVFGEWDDDDILYIGSITNSKDLYTSDGAYLEEHPGADQSYIVKIDPRPGKLPVAPSNLVGTPSTIDVALTWGRPSDEGGCRIVEYRIEKLNDSGSWDLLNASYTFRCTDEDVENGEAYRYRVSAVSDAGQGAYATVSVTVPPVVPTSPLNLTAFTGNGTITLNWSAPTWSGGARLEGYDIFRGPTTTDITRIARSNTAPSFVDTDVELGEFYIYKVAARNSAGTGADSKTVRIKALDLPSPPRDFNAEGRDGSVRLTWTQPAEDGGSMLIGYYIFRGTAADNMSLLATKTVVQQEHVDASVVNGRSYIYRMTAFSDVGESESSPALDATPFGLPGRVADLVATAGNGIVVLNWSAPEDNGGRQINKYKILCGESVGDMTVLTTIGNVTTFSHTGLTNGITYYYAVIAVNLAGEGQESEAVSARPMAISGPPTDLSVTTEIGGVRVTWHAPEDIGGADLVTFKVMRSDTPDGTDAMVYDAYSALEFRDVNVSVGGTYYYRVQSQTSFGVGATAGPVEVLVTTVPGSVRNLTTTYGDGEVHLIWTAPEDDGGSPILVFVVKRGIFVTGLVEIDRVNALNFTDAGLDNGNEYLYVVIAVNAIGQGPQSEVITGIPLGRPTAPGLFKAKVEDKTIGLSWAVPTGPDRAPVSGYVVLRATGDGNFDVLAQISPETSYIDTDVRAGVQYRYIVKAVSDVGEGDAAEEITAKVKKDEEGPGFSIMILIPALIIIMILINRTRRYAME